jgi:hypothetical protein
MLSNRYKPLFARPFHGAFDSPYRAVYIWAKSQGPPPPMPSRGSEDATDTAPMQRAIALNRHVATAAAAAFAAAAALAAAAAWPPLDFDSLGLGAITSASVDAGPGPW